MGKLQINKGAVSGSAGPVGGSQAGHGGSSCGVPEDKEGRGPTPPNVTWLMAFTVPGKPVAKNKKRKYLTTKEREYQEHVGWAFKDMVLEEEWGVGTPLEGEVGIYIIFYKGLKKDGTRHQGKWDTDNHVKPIKDALSGLAYDDDKQIRWSGEEIRDCDYGQDQTVVWLGRKES